MYLRTNIPHLDIILSGKGLKLGKIYEIFGDESVSKSTIAQFFAKKFQEQELGQILYFDTEQSFDKVRFAYMGGDLNNITIDNTIVLEDIFKKIDEFIETNGTSLIILDTVASTVLKKELDDKDYSDGIAAKPRFLSRHLPKIKDLLERTQSTLILVNQVYDLINTKGKRTKGGRAIRFFSDVRIDIKKKAEFVENLDGIEYGKAIGVELFTKKNKLFYPNLTAQIVVSNDEGVKEIESIMYFLEENNFVSKNRAWKRFVFQDIDFKYNNAESFLKNVRSDEKVIIAIRYVICERFINISPLVKVKLIDEVNKMEELLGLPLTELTEREKRLAQIQEQILKEQEGELQ